MASSGTYPVDAVNRAGDERTALGRVIVRYPLGSFFVMAYAFTWAFWSIFIFSEDGRGTFSYDSPLSYMWTIGIGIFLGPFLASIVVPYVTDGMDGIRDFVYRITLWRVGFRWYLVVLVGVPVMQVFGTIILPGILGSYTSFNLFGIGRAHV